MNAFLKAVIYEALSMNGKYSDNVTRFKVSSFVRHNVTPNKKNDREKNDVFRKLQCVQYKFELSMTNIQMMISVLSLYNH